MKNQFRLFVVVFSLFLLAFAIPTAALAGGCFPPEQCGKNGVVCYPEGSPENAICQAAQPGSRAGSAPLLDPKDIEHCLGVNVTIPLDECREIVATANATDYVGEFGQSPDLTLPIGAGVVLIMLGVVLYLKSKNNS